jgi:hypothetical protein
MQSLHLVIVAVAVAGCGGGGGFPADAAIDSSVPGGKLSVAWSLADTASQPITCSDVGGQVVTLVLRNHDVAGASTEVFGCTSASGTTPEVAAGIYDVDFELHGVVGLLTTATQQMGITITSGQTTELAPVTFALDATGAVELDLATGKSGGNCAATTAMGAGITATTISLVHSPGSVCEPVTFTISAGATRPAGTYTVDCATPVVGPCIEADQKLTVASMPSGSYAIHVLGKVGALDCFKNDDVLKVPPLMKLLKQTLSLAQQTTPGC